MIVVIMRIAMVLVMLMMLQLSEVHNGNESRIFSSTWRVIVVWLRYDMI